MFGLDVGTKPMKAHNGPLHRLIIFDGMDSISKTIFFPFLYIKIIKIWIS